VDAAVVGASVSQRVCHPIDYFVCDDLAGLAANLNDSTDAAHNGLNRNVGQRTFRRRIGQ
jgi:hypothetical protein